MEVDKSPLFDGIRSFVPGDPANNPVDAVSAAPQFSGDDFSAREDDRIRRRVMAARKMLDSADLETMDRDAAKAMYESVTQAIHGIPDTDGTIWFGSRRSDDPRKNLGMVREVMNGNWKLLQDPESQKFEEGSDEERVRMAKENEGFWQTVGRWFKMGVMNGASASSVTGYVDPAAYEAAVNRSKAVIENADRELVAKQREKYANNQKLLTLLAAKGSMSDRAGYILTKSLIDGNIDPAQLLTLGDDDQEKVLAGFKAARGEKTHGELLGLIDMDFTQGTAVGNRAQMALHAAQQALVGLATDSFKWGSDLRLWWDNSETAQKVREGVAAKFGIKTEHDAAWRAMMEEKRTFMKALTAVRRTEEASEQPYPDGGFFGAPLQGVAENWHWFIPYGIGRYAKGAKAALKAGSAADKLALAAERQAIRAMGKATAAADAVGFGSKYFERTMDEMAFIVKRHEDAMRKIADVTRTARRLEAAKAGGYDALAIGAKYMTTANFAQEFLETADAAGMSREESVPISIGVALVNDRIEQLNVPGLNESMRPAALKSISMKNFVEACRRGQLSKYIKNRLAQTLPAGAKVGLTEGAVEEPLQQIVIEHGKLVAEDLAKWRAGEKTLDEATRQAIVDAVVPTADDLKTYVDVVADMLPMSFGYLATTGVREQAHASMRRFFANHGIGAFNSEHFNKGRYDEPYADHLMREKLLRTEVSRFIMGQEEPAATVETKKPSAPKSERSIDEFNADGSEKNPGAGENEVESLAGLMDRVSSESKIEVNDLIEKARGIYQASANGGDTVKALMGEIGMPQRLAELAADHFADEELYMLFDTEAARDVKQYALAKVTPEDLATHRLADGESYRRSENGDMAYLEFAVGDRKVRVLYRNADSWFLNDKGEVDVERFNRELEDDSNLGQSFNARSRGRRWEDLSLIDRKVYAVRVWNGYTNGGGTFTFTDAKTGREVTVEADAVVNLATGNIADIAREVLPSDLAESMGPGERATQTQVEHETFHALWSVYSETLSDKEKESLATAVGVSPENLEETMAYQFERYATGAYVQNPCETQFQKLQAKFADLLGKMGFVRRDVTDENGKPFSLGSFYQAVLEGRVGSGNMGIEHISTIKPAPGGTKVSEGELPVDVTKEDEKAQEQKEVAQAAEETSEKPEPAQDRGGKVAAESDWDKGDTLKLRIPNKPGRVVVKLRVMNVFDVKNSFAAGGTQKYQNRGDTQESKEMRAKIAANPDFEQAGAAQAMLGGATLVTDKDANAIVGNHRIDGIQEAYRQGNAAAYRSRTISEAEARGLPMDERALEEPVIVGEVTAIEDNAELRIEELGEAGNTPTMRGFNFYEEAQNDAKIIEKEGIVAGIVTKPDGSIDSAASLPAIKNFIDKTGAQGMIDENAVLTEKGQERIGAAMAAMLIGTGEAERPLLRKLLADTRTLDIENEVRGIVKVASDLLRLAAERPLYDIRADLRDALEKYTSWREADEAKRAEKDKTRAQWAKKGGYKYDDFAAQQDLFKAENEVADLIAKRLAESRAQRSFAQNGDETAAGQERAIRHVADWFEKFIERARNTNVETDDMFGTPPASAADLLGLKFSVANIPGLYHGSAANWTVPSLDYVGKGQGQAVQGYGFNATTDRAAAEMWGRLSAAPRPRNFLEKVGYMIHVPIYLYESTLTEANVIGYFDDASYYLPKLQESVKSRGYLQDVNWFLNPKKQKTVQGLERFLISGVRKGDGSRLNPRERAELMVDAGIDANVVDTSAWRNAEAERIYVVYNTGKLKLDHKWKDGARKFSVATRKLQPATADEFAEIASRLGTRKSGESDVMSSYWMLPDGTIPNAVKGATHDSLFYILNRKGQDAWFDSYYDMLGGGAIRIKPTEGFEIMTNPTDEQYDALWDMIEKQYQEASSRGYETMLIDVDDESGGTIFSVEYPIRTSPRRIISDLKAWYDERIVPEGAFGAIVELGKEYAERAGFSVAPERFSDSGYKFWTLPEKIPSREQTTMQTFVGDRARWLDAVYSFERSQYGVMIGTRRTMQPGEVENAFNMTSPLARVEVGWPVYQMMRNVRYIQEPGEGVSLAKFIARDVDKAGRYVVPQWDAEAVRRHLETDGAADSYHRQALFFAAMGMVSGLTDEEIGDAAKRLVAESSERMDALAKLVGESGATSVISDGRGFDLSDAVAEYVSARTGLPVGMSGSTAIVAFSTNAHGGYVEVMKNAVVGGNAVSGIFAACHESGYQTFMLDDLTPGKDGMALTSRYGDAHEALRKIAAFANPYWTANELKGMKGYENLLNLLSRFTRSGLNALDGRALVGNMERYGGMEGMAEAIRNEHARVERAKVGSVAMRKRPIADLHINDSAGGRVATAATFADANRGERHGFMNPATGDIEAATDFEIVSKYGDMLFDSDFATLRESFIRVVAPRIDGYAKQIAGLLGKGADAVHVFRIIEDGTSQFFEERTHMAVVSRLKSDYGFRYVYSTKAYVGKSYRGTSVRLEETPTLNAPVLILAPSMATGASIVETAEAIREKFGTSPHSRKISAAAFTASLGDRLVLHMSQLRSQPGFGTISAKRLNKTLGFDYGNLTVPEAAQAGLVPEDGIGVSRPLQYTGGMRDGTGLSEGSRPFAGSFSVGEVAGVPHVVAALSGRQRQGDAFYPGAAAEVASVIDGDARFSVAEYRDLLTRRRPDLAPEDVAAYMDVIRGYDKPKKRKLAVHWLVTGAIELPEDGYKLDKAISTAERAKVDPFQYRNPEDIFAAFPQHLPKDPAIDPDMVAELTEKEDRGHGVTVYTVQDDRDGQAAMRKIINTHWGKDANPWCLLQGDGNGKLESAAWQYWEHYSALPKKVAFHNGKLLAFMATDDTTAAEDAFRVRPVDEMPFSYTTWKEKFWKSENTPEQWWDRKDASHAGIPIEGKIQGDELGRSGVMELQDGKLTVVGKLWRGNKQNGVYEEWDGPTKTLHEEFKDGKLDGRVLSWNKNEGTLRALQDYKDGKPVGWHRVFNEYGQPSLVEHFDENGEHDIPQIEYNIDGSLRRMVRYEKGDKPVENIVFYSDGELMSYHKAHDLLPELAYWKDNGENISWTDEAGNYYSVRVGALKNILSASVSWAGSERMETIASYPSEAENIDAGLRETLARGWSTAKSDIQIRADQLREQYAGGTSNDELYGAVADRADAYASRPNFSVANRRYSWSDYPNLHDRVIHATSHIHMVGHDDPVTDRKYETFKAMKRISPERARLMAEDMTLSIWAKERCLGKYLLGKHFGYETEALEAVRHYYTPKNMDQLAQIVAKDRPVRWVYVHNTDGMNTNMIPLAFATMLADRFGGEVENRIMKKSDERNTGASMQDRAGRNFEWYGEPDLSGNPQLFVVDDVWTTGSTTVSLLEYLKDRGADVRAIVTVAVASNTDHIMPTSEDYARVLKKSKLSTVEEASKVVGFDMRKLTGSELYAYGVKGAKGKGGLARWYERAWGLFEVPGGLFSDPQENGDDAQGASGAAPAVRTRFSTAFPRIDRMADDDLIVSALAAGMVTNPQKASEKSKRGTFYGYYRKHRKEVEALVLKAHPELASDYGELTALASMIMMRAQTTAREMKRDLEAGVSESEILRRLPKKMEPVYLSELQEQRKAGGMVMAYGTKARMMVEDRWQRKVANAVSVQAGVDTDLFEQWAGVDFSETLAKILNNPREIPEDERKKIEQAVEPPDEAQSAGGSPAAGGMGGAIKAVEELEDPRKFADYVVALGAKYWRQTHGLGEYVDPWKDAVALQFMRRTAKNLYHALVRDIVYSGARETASKAIERFENAATIWGLKSQMTFVGEIIHARRIRESKQALCNEIDTLLKTKLGAQGRFKVDREELRRKVSAELELRARYMRHAMWLTKDAAKDEGLQLSRRMDKLLAGYGEAERDVEQSREYREIQRQLNILREFGSLRYRSLGEIETAKRYWEEQAAGSSERILQAQREREVRTTKAAEILAAAVQNPKQKDRAESGVAQDVNNYIVGHMGFVSMLQDMIRHSNGQKRTDAESIIHYLALEIQKAGDRARLEERQQSDAFFAAVEQIYRKPFRKVMAEMNERDARFEPYMGKMGGKRIAPTKARAMQLLVSLLQGRRPGDDYFDNVVKHDRQKQAAEISAMLTTEDMNLISWLGQWYENNRKDLSDVCEYLFGIGVYSESPRYFPVKMRMEKMGLETVEGVGWTIFPKALTPRIRNERDFDTQADILSMWMSRMQEGAQWKAHAKLGLELRGIFGRSQLQEAVSANHGNKVNTLMLEFITDILAGNGNSSRTESGVEKASDWVRGWTALSALGGNIGVTFKQTTSIPAFGFEIGLRKTAQYVLSAFSPAGFDAMAKIWRSEQRKTRWNIGSSEAVANALNKRDAGALKRMFQAAMITNKVGDAVPGLVVGQGIYRDCIDRGMSAEDAMAETWMLIERTQQSSRLENQPKLQRRIKFGRMLYQFLSTQQQYLQYEMRAVRELAANPNLNTTRKLIRTLALNHFILTSLYYWMGELYKMVLGQEPPEDRLKDWMISNLLGPFGSLFVLGFCCKYTLERAIKGKQYGHASEMLPMESYIKNQVEDASDLLGAIFDNEKGWDEVVDEAAQWASDINSTVRDLRKIDRYRLRPERYEKKRKVTRPVR